MDSRRIAASQRAARRTRGRLTTQPPHPTTCGAGSGGDRPTMAASSFLLFLLFPRRMPQRTIEPEDDELVGVRLTGHATVAERIVVVVEQADAARAKRDDTLDRLKRESEDGTEPGEIVWIGDV